MSNSHAAERSYSPARRARRLFVRVRTGCITCKKRRIKCDEGKPHCQRCIRSGWSCEGYPEPLRDRYEHSLLLTTSFYALPFRIPGSQHDRQIFHYYVTHAVKDLCGHSLGALDFWGRLVMETSCHQPLVRDMVIALASIHRDYATIDPAEGGLEAGPSDATMNQYNKALRRFRICASQGQDMGREELLICCVLFHCFESVRGEYEWAARHLEAGLRILESSHTGALSGAEASGEAADGTVGIVRAMLVRLDFQLSVYNDTRVPSFALASGDVVTGKTDCVPARFDISVEAQTTLNTLQNWFLRFIIQEVKYKNAPAETLPHEVQQELQALKTQLALWNLAFKQLVPPEADASEANAVRQGMRLMKLNYSLCCAMLSFGYPQAGDEPTLSVQLHTLFTEIESLLEADARSDDSLPRSVSSNMEIVMPLFLLSVKCRDTQLRHRTLEVLSSIHKQEGLLNAKTMAGIVSNAMKLEHEGKTFPAGDETVAVEYWAEDVLNVAEDYRSLATKLSCQSGQIAI